MNKIFLTGHVGNDPELFDNGNVINAKFSFATNERVKKGDDWVNETMWHNIILWGHKAQWVAKGQHATIEGKILYETWDKTDGTKGYKTTIKVLDIDLSGNSKNDNSQLPQNQTTEPTQSTTSPNPGEGDLPF